MYQLILILHILVSIVLVALVLIQHGKGADIGASFGSGASNTVFGSQGTGGFLFRATAGLALVFFVTSLSLSYLVSIQHQSSQEMIIPVDSKSINDTIPVPADTSPDSI
jgi:preprotein translocase subunit SecG